MIVSEVLPFSVLQEYVTSAYMLLLFIPVFKTEWYEMFYKFYRVRYFPYCYNAFLNLEITNT